MSSESQLVTGLEFRPLTPEHWKDLETLFGQTGGDDGCWCMWWRLSQNQFAAQRGETNKQAMKRIVDSGEIPGLLAYRQGEPIAWCSVGPRKSYPKLERSRRFKRVDGQDVWSIVCFYVQPQSRGQGLMVPILDAAVEQARKSGAKIVEGYPVDPEGRLSSAVSGYMGILPAFQTVGFEEVLRRSERQPIMRRYL